MKIADFLLNGEENAISLERLATVTALPERAVRAEVLRARIAGELILSSDKGYFLPECDDDIRRYVITRKACIKTSCMALRPFVKAMKMNEA